MKLVLSYLLVLACASTSASNSSEEYTEDVFEVWPSPSILAPTSNGECRLLPTIPLVSLIEDVPKEILDYIFSLTDRRSGIAMCSTCSSFKDYALPCLSSSFGFLYHNWIGEGLGQLKLFVSPGNEEFKIEEFVLASKNKFVAEVHFSSFKYFILALQSGFIPKRNQKISISSSDVSSFDSEMDLYSLFEKLNLSDLHIDKIRIKASDKEDIPYLKSFLEFFNSPKLSLSKLDLILDDAAVKELVSLLSNSTFSSLSIRFDSANFLIDEILQWMQRNALNIKDMNLKYKGEYDQIRDVEIFLMNELFPIIMQFDNLEMLNPNIVLPLTIYMPSILQPLIEMSNEYLLSHPKIKLFPNWSDLPEFKHLSVLLSPRQLLDSLQTLQLAKLRGTVHDIEIEKLSKFKGEHRTLILNVLEENSQNFLIGRLFCDIEDFHSHFHKLSVMELHLTCSNQSEDPRAPLFLSSTTQILYCSEFIPVFGRTFPTLNTVILHFKKNEINLDHYETFANSYQSLQLLEITCGPDCETPGLELKLAQIYADSPRTFDQVLTVIGEAIFEE